MHLCRPMRDVERVRRRLGEAGWDRSKEEGLETENWLELTGRRTGERQDRPTQRLRTFRFGSCYDDGQSRCQLCVSCLRGCEWWAKGARKSCSRSADDIDDETLD